MSVCGRERGHCEKNREKGDRDEDVKSGETRKGVLGNGDGRAGKDRC